MKPYYEGDGITLYHGRCEDALPLLAPGSAHVLLTDPPYFQVKDEDWDNQWDKASEFLDWLGSVLSAAKPALTANASVWVFASPALTSAVESVVAKDFRVLNSIRWVKPSSIHNKMEIASLRRFMSPWEGLLFAETADDLYGDASDALHRKVFAPVGAYIQGERERANLNRRRVAAALVSGGRYKNEDSANANIFNWELGKNLIASQDYQVMRDVLGQGYLSREHADIAREYEDLRREYEDLRREYEDLRRPFALDETMPTSDVWNFRSVPAYPGKHPCEKPGAMLRHMIQTSSRPGDTILDAFAGSGSTLLAARDTGRKAIGIEMDERWCEHAARKLSQGVLEFPA